MAAPISNKVSAGTLTGAAVTAITWILTQYIPTWHSGIPATLAALLPGIVGAAGYFAGGYLARHYPAADEVLETALKVIEQQRKKPA
jgi:hypothetical protein